jgi:hypothetical protein
MTENLPSLPTDPLLKVFVISASLGLVSFALAAFLKWRDHLRLERPWLLAPLVLAALAIVAGRSHADLHRSLSVLILAVGLRNVWRMEGHKRWLSALASTLWLTSMALARHLF